MNIDTEITNFKQFISFLDFFDDNIISQFHARESTYNNHYRSFAIMEADSTHNRKIEIIADAANEKWVVEITVTDNSNSYDSYYVLLSEVYTWYINEKRKELLEKQLPLKESNPPANKI